LRVVESTTITRPPASVRARLPVAYRYLLPLIDPVIGRTVRLTLFQAVSLRTVGLTFFRGGFITERGGASAGKPLLVA
jgi:hypothetical protein